MAYRDPIAAAAGHEAAHAVVAEASRFDVASANTAKPIRAVVERGDTAT